MFNGLWCALRPIPPKNWNYIFHIDYWIPGLATVAIVEFLKPFYAAQNLYKNCVKL